ncbi:transcriptional regulator [Lysinibacillus sp. 2017]|uniref:LCP family protein n=1 Tax=unclassified Lysinibacillus TaxID=2636778 RepID=UPI000D5263BB|nr:MULTISPECIES: LCP family protein [unclassified Lysinibacillus]AWE07487.1 transcriptional regulator [Lysinibacillus sp. 2017]TGN36650.1 LytR family transcriptional regulator [Lysinibacillus sp. S2017]
MEENSRPVRFKKKKKLRKGRTLFAILFLIIAGLLIFSYMQYQNGLKLADETNMPAEDFTPDDDDEIIENILIIGVDSRGEEQSRSDTMMLLSWNQDTNKMKLVSFMRDIYADIPEYQSYKLNTAYYLGGVSLLQTTLNNMFDITVDHYALIDFKSFETLIDILAPNGIEMDVEKNMSGDIKVELTKGLQKLDGKELLGYARFRSDSEGDFGRVARQQKVIEALKDELVSPKNMKNIPKFIGAAQGYITTDISSRDQLATVLKAVTGGGMGVEKLTIPAEGTYEFKEYRHAGSVLQIDKEKNKQILHDFLQLTE